MKLSTKCCPSTIDTSSSLCLTVIRIRHPASHHGKGGPKQLAGQCHLCGKLQRCQLPPAAGGSGPTTGEEVCHRPGGWEAAEHAGTGDATMTSAFIPFGIWKSHWITSNVICSLLEWFGNIRIKMQVRMYVSRVGQKCFSSFSANYRSWKYRPMIKNQGSSLSQMKGR